MKGSFLKKKNKWASPTHICHLLPDGDMHGRFSKAPQTTQDSASKHKWKAEGAVQETEIKTNLKFNTS